MNYILDNGFESFLLLAFDAGDKKNIYDVVSLG